MSWTAAAGAAAPHNLLQAAAGEAFIIPNGKPHNATNAGPGMASIVVTYIVEKGKPLATPVK